MPLKCDICMKAIPKGSGYALTTTQVTSTPAYWKYAFTHQWSYVGESTKFLGVTIKPEEAIEGIVRQLCSSRTPWLVCDSCIELFEVDRESCATLAKRYTAEMPRGWKQKTGPGDNIAAFFAAKKAYQSVFKKWWQFW